MSKYADYTMAQIQKERNEMKRKLRDKLEMLGRQQIDFFMTLGKEYAINIDMLRSENDLAIEIRGLEEAIAQGNKEAIQVKKTIIQAKTNLEKQLKVFADRKRKLIDESNVKEKPLDERQAVLTEAITRQADENYQKVRATKQEVDALTDGFNQLRQEVNRYKVDRHLIAQVENLKAENAVVKGQLQKILTVMRSRGWDLG